MRISRRELIVLGGVAGLAGCAGQRSDDGGAALLDPLGEAPVEVGSAADYPHDGIYDRFRRSNNFFLVRHVDRLFAQSAICPHRDCRNIAFSSGFRCPCHGSTFTMDGNVTRGPARSDLPRIEMEQNPQGRLIVHLERRLIAPGRFDAPQAFVVLA